MNTISGVSITGVKIALIGEQHSGKSTTANLIYRYLTEYNIGSSGPLCDNVFTLKFAESLHNAWEELIEDNPYQPKNREWFTSTAKVWKSTLGDDIFVRLFKNRVNEMNKIWTRPNIVCDDCRSKLEFETCKSLGFKTVYIDADEETRIKRLGGNGIKYQEQEYDETDTDISDLKYQCDYVIFNNRDKDLTYLEAEVDEMIMGYINEGEIV